MRKILSIILFSFVMAVFNEAIAKEERLSFMSFNISGQRSDEGGDHSWEARKKACMKAIKKYDPDVICLQEAYSYHKTFLMKEFPKHTLVDRSDKPGTVDPELRDNETPIMFRADRLELLDYGSFWLNEGQSPGDAGWDASAPRTVTWVKLRYRKSGVIFFCFNTKFDSKGEVAGKRSSELMVDKVKEIAGDSAVVFLGGDFGMSSSDRSMSVLASYAKDANFLQKKPDSRPSFNAYGKKGDFMPWPDHILARNANVIRYEVVDARKFGAKFISDHNPLYAEFGILIPKGK